MTLAAWASNGPGAPLHQGSSITSLPLTSQCGPNLWRQKKEPHCDQMALTQYSRSALQPKYMPVNTRPNNPINGIVEPVFGRVA
jgi:hypothetical protein